MGNLFATIVGVLVGVPIALELNRRQQAAAQAITNAERTANEKQRKTKILTLLRSELTMNKKQVLEMRSPMESGGVRGVSVGSLNDQLWSAFSDGGELQYINNPQLLASIADAYYHVRTCISLEKKILDIVHFPGMRIRQDKPPEEFVRGYLSETDNVLLATIDAALSNIEAELALPEIKA